MKKCVPYFALLLIALSIATLLKMHNESLNQETIFALSKVRMEKQKKVKIDSSIIAKEKTMGKKEMAFAKQRMK